MKKYHLLFAILLFSNSAFADENAVKLENSLQSISAKITDKLSEEGWDAFKQSQMEWQKSIGQLCDERNLQRQDITSAKCMFDKYQIHKQQLENYVVVTNDGMVIRRDEYFAVHDEGKDLGVTNTYIAWPQIDDPKTDSQRSWNKFMADEKPKEEQIEGHFCDYSVDYKIPYVSGNIVAVKISDWFYCHGAPHGYGGTRAINTGLSEAHELLPTDIFSAKTDWQNSIHNLAMASLKSDGKADVARIKQTDFKSTRSWIITDRELQINYGSVNGYAGGDYIAHILWESLKPYLKEDSPFK